VNAVSVLRFGHNAGVALSLGALALVPAGCSGAPPIGALGAMPRSPEVAKPARFRNSWILREAKEDDLLYVSSSCTSGCNVYMFSYPGGQLVGQLTGFNSPGNLCADNKGHVWITDPPSGRILKYMHGGTKSIGRLIDNNFPLDCSVDPATGDLAVGNASYTAPLSIYKHGAGPPVVYSGTGGAPFSCAYDDRGDVIMAGPVGPYAKGLTVLASGGKSIREFTTHPHVYPNGGVQWYGGYITALNRRDQIVRFALVNGGGKFVSLTQLSGAFPQLYWIQGSLVAGTDDYSVYFWKYPAGGNPIKTLSAVPNPYGITVSLAPR
jgi:hypothetical protein